MESIHSLTVSCYLVRTPAKMSTNFNPNPNSILRDVDIFAVYPQ